MPKRQIMSLRDANYLIKETVIQSNYGPAETVKLLRIVEPEFKARLTDAGEIEIEDLE